jgi:hypothetical protein
MFLFIPDQLSLLLVNQLEYLVVHAQPNRPLQMPFPLITSHQMRVRFIQIGQHVLYIINIAQIHPVDIDNQKVDP